MDDDEILARVLRRFLVSKEFWDCWVNEEFGTASLNLDGIVKLSLDEAEVVGQYQHDA